MLSNPSLIVLDTSVVSILIRRAESATYYRERIVGRRAVISFQTLEELWFGAYKGNWGDRRMNTLRQNLDRYEVMWPNSDLIRISAHLRSERESVGRRLNTGDAWVAATALLLECPLASDDHDFSDIPDLELIQAPAPQPDQLQE